MKIDNVIIEIEETLNKTFSEIELWLGKDASLRSYRPENGGWTIDEILEHISLTNHFLLILIDKGTKKALQKAKDLDLAEETRNYAFKKDKLTEISLHNSFPWFRPEHMEPKGEIHLNEVKTQLSEQLFQCQNYLKKMKNGEGVLYKTTMSVNSLGKIDVYEYIYFLAQHGQRHITQMKKNEIEFQSSK